LRGPRIHPRGRRFASAAALRAALGADASASRPLSSAASLCTRTARRFIWTARRWPRRPPREGAVLPLHEPAVLFQSAGRTFEAPRAGGRAPAPCEKRRSPKTGRISREI
jgi:hypothetical protein